MVSISSCHFMDHFLCVACEELYTPTLWFLSGGKSRILQRWGALPQSGVSNYVSIIMAVCQEVEWYMSPALPMGSSSSLGIWPHQVTKPTGASSKYPWSMFHGYYSLIRFDAAPMHCSPLHKTTFVCVSQRCVAVKMSWRSDVTIRGNTNIAAVVIDRPK